MVTIAKCIWSALQWEFNHGSRIQCTNCNTRVPPWPDCWQFVLKKKAKGRWRYSRLRKAISSADKAELTFPIIVLVVTRFLISRVHQQQIFEVLETIKCKILSVFLHVLESSLFRDIFCYEQHILPLKLGRSFTIKSRPVSSAQLKTF